MQCHLAGTAMWLARASTDGREFADINSCGLRIIHWPACRRTLDGRSRKAVIWSVASATTSQPMTLWEAGTGLAASRCWPKPAPMTPGVAHSTKPFKPHLWGRQADDGADGGARRVAVLPAVLAHAVGW